MTVRIGIYDDHAASAASDELEYAFLCDPCARKRGGDVGYLTTIPVGEPAGCDVCGDLNGEDYEEEEEGYYTY